MLVARAQEIVAADGVPFIRAKAQAWRELFPDEAAEKAREREVKAMIAAGTEDALTALHEIIMDTTHKDRASAAKSWVEHDIGRAKQAVELGGTEGGPLRIVVTQDDTGLL
jgi:hypothetical protein